MSGLDTLKALSALSGGGRKAPAEEIVMEPFVPPTLSEDVSDREILARVLESQLRVEHYVTQTLIALQSSPFGSMFPTIPAVQVAESSADANRSE